MAIFTVTTADDVSAADGVRSLREAVNSANATAGADTIVFAPALGGHTLTLTQGELLLTQDVTIGGVDNNSSRVTISGGDASRIFHVVGDATDVSLADLTLIHGRPPGPELVGAGGAVLVGGGSLELTGATVRDNTGYGGGIYATAGSRVSVTDSTIADNQHDWAGGNPYASGGGIATGANVTVTVQHSSFTGNNAYGTAAGTHPDGGGAIHLGQGGHLTVDDSIVTGNSAYTAGGILLDTNSSATITRSIIAHNDGAIGGGIYAAGSDLNIFQSAVIDNSGNLGAGISSSGSQITINSSTIAANQALYDPLRGSGYGGGLLLGSGGELTLRNSTVTGNLVTGPAGYATVEPGVGGGILAFSGAHLDIANSIVAGNTADIASDIQGTITSSNGHNLFGSTVAGSIPGDQQNIAADTIFAAIDLVTGGGLANADGEVLLRGNAGNPALGAADLFAAMPTDQLGHARPQPAGSLADLGAAESSQALSTHASSGNDLLTGTSKGESISGFDGADRIFGAAGADTLNGNAGSDVLEGGTGNDKLNGGTGVDTAYYGGSTGIRADLSGAADTVQRGTETDTLTGIEGVVGSRAADSFTGDGNANWFMGGDGKDLYTGGGGRDTFDFNTVNDSRVGASARDVITDFTHGTDKVDLSGIDADTTRPGDQAFHWVSSAAFTGAPGELGFFTSGANTVIQASNDGDTVGELQIQLTGHPSLSASDFYL